MKLILKLCVMRILISPLALNPDSVPVYNSSTRVIVGNGSTLVPISHVGSYYLNSKTKPLHFSSVYHVLNLKQNLILIKRLCHDNNCHVIFDNFSIFVQDKETRIVLL